ncbi:hypothetical protein T11_9493 [Trichinella zimbabwensis]|uniref:Uncharacterized protein n=1 Tax=Trichinella zimbabwensis TaxID=268475 RepID=A0A0V1GYX7_9BILA|nr:hypothetical protein T11_9493 [Trichinella zimbabwensis]
MYHSLTNHILIFAIEAGVKLLDQSDCWCRMRPLTLSILVHQLLTFHVVMERKLPPVTDCFTVRKDLLTYSQIFENMHCKAENLGVQLDPATSICDFKIILILAIQGNFPTSGYKVVFSMFAKLCFICSACKPWVSKC